MKYEIITNADPLSGVNLLLKFPEEELDEKAVYTLQHDWPEFLVPFRYQVVDGEIEVTYQPGERGKLRFFSGQKTPDEYVKFWEWLLQPLLDCDDWFLKPFSMVMDPEYLYRDKTGVISYLYVPIKNDFSGYDELQDMMYRLGRDNSVADSQLENVVLHMLVEKVQPKVFLDTLQKQQRPKAAPVPVYAETSEKAPLPPKEFEQVKQEEPQLKPVLQPAQTLVPDRPSGGNDIVIDLHGGKIGKKEEKQKKKEKSVKPPRGGLFGGKKDKNGSKAPLSPASISIPVQPIAPAQIVPSEHAQAASLPASDETELEEYGTGLRLVGMMGLPKMIQVEIAIGGIFSVGRYDIQLKQRQSSFEFPANTKAVSRRHAVIERDADGYSVTDLGSKAGTFVNGMALKVNFPYRIQRGDKISFGTSGADYIWEE